MESSSVGRWEAGASIPEPERLEALAKVFDVDWWYFFAPEQAIRPPEPTKEQALAVIARELGIEMPATAVPRKKLNRSAKRVAELLPALNETQAKDLLSYAKARLAPLDTIEESAPPLRKSVKLRRSES